MPLIAETQIRVRYADTDQMGIAHHSAHIVWLEEGRVDFCRAAGFSYKDIEDGGIAFVVVEALCRYRAPARFEDKLVVLTRLKDLRKKRLTFSYCVKKADDDTRIAEGETTHISVNGEGRPVPIPEKYYKFLEKTLGD